MSDRNSILTRRHILQAAGGLAFTSALAPAAAAGDALMKNNGNILRWGVVGTGMIANQMAPMIRLADNGTLAAVSSRRMESAKAFATEHGVPHALDSWQDMLASDLIDAVYVATPTSVREEISVAAARQGKHVLGEKPFASLESLQRITAACRENGVGFMDGTHFAHHPRTFAVRDALPDKVGAPTELATCFQFFLSDDSNIRLNPTLEPLGAIGDLGWYNVRAANEYISPEADIADVSAFARRHPETGAVVSASGLIVFTDGSTTTFHCGFDSNALNMDLRIAGSKGQITMYDFLANRGDGNASYVLRQQGFGPDAGDTIDVESAKPGAALMFEDFGAMTADKTLFEKSVAVSERTQHWLDAIWNAASNNANKT